MITSILKLRFAYKTMFSSPNADMCMHDLARFCGADKTSFRSDPYEAARAAGRREVWLRIQDFLNMEDSDVKDLARKFKPTRQGEDYDG